MVSKSKTTSMLPVDEAPPPVDEVQTVPDETGNSAGELSRKRTSMGSVRRINRAMETFAKASKAFCEDIDRQIFLTDAEGMRCGSWEGVDATRKFTAQLAEELERSVQSDMKTGVTGE